MAVKGNVSVSTKADLQNLITSLILKQAGEFTLYDIIQVANSQLMDSAYYASEELKFCCADTLQTLFLFNGIQLVGKGKYTISHAWPAVSAR